jgi:hypothetical protein
VATKVPSGLTVRASARPERLRVVSAVSRTPPAATSRPVRVVPGVSSSQRLPTRSWSASAWVGLRTRGQLSALSGQPSLSSSSSQASPRPSPSVSVWGGLGVSEQLSTGCWAEPSGTPSRSRSASVFTTHSPASHSSPSAQSTSAAHCGAAQNPISGSHTSASGQSVSDAHGQLPPVQVLGSWQVRLMQRCPAGQVSSARQDCGVVLPALGSGSSLQDAALNPRERRRISPPTGRWRRRTHSIGRLLGGMHHGEQPDRSVEPLGCRVQPLSPCFLCPGGGQDALSGSPSSTPPLKPARV